MRFGSHLLSFNADMKFNFYVYDLYDVADVDDTFFPELSEYKSFILMAFFPFFSVSFLFFSSRIFNLKSKPIVSCTIVLMELVESFWVLWHHKRMR